MISIPALVHLTMFRMASKSLDELPGTVAKRLVCLLGREQVYEILNIDDLELMIHDQVGNGGPACSSSRGF